MEIKVQNGIRRRNYEIIQEKELHPIINVSPNEEDIFNKIEELVLHPEKIPELSRQSIDYVQKHHDHIDVAKKYIDFWEKH